MSAAALPLSELATSRRWQSNFLAVLPAVETHAAIQFRHLKPEARAEATAETVARAFVEYGLLAQRHHLAHAYPGSLATYAVQRVRGHRQVGGHQSTKDVLHPLAQKKHGLAVTSLTPWDGTVGVWRDLLLESRRVSPADQACFNLDFQAWLKTWPPRHRQIIAALAAGHGTLAVARKFAVTEGRVSQLRRRYQDSWESFQGADTAVKAA